LGRLLHTAPQLLPHAVPVDLVDTGQQGGAARAGARLAQAKDLRRAARKVRLERPGVEIQDTHVRRFQRQAQPLLASLQRALEAVPL